MPTPIRKRRFGSNNTKKRSRKKNSRKKNSRKKSSRGRSRGDVDGLRIKVDRTFVENKCC